MFYCRGLEDFLCSIAARRQQLTYEPPRDALKEGHRRQAFSLQQSIQSDGQASSTFKTVAWIQATKAKKKKINGRIYGTCHKKKGFPVNFGGDTPGDAPL